MPPQVSFFGRACDAWGLIEASASREVVASLRPGATPEVLAELESALGHPLPAAMAAILTVHDGQSLAFDEALDASEDERGAFDESIGDGLFGGYRVYDHWVNTRY